MYYLITDQRSDRPVEMTPAVKLTRSLRNAMLLVGILVFVLGGLAAFLPMASAVICFYFFIKGFHLSGWCFRTHSEFLIDCFSCFNN